MIKLRKLLHKRLNKLYLLGAAVVILMLAGVTYVVLTNNNLQTDPTDTANGPNVPNGPNVDLSPATPEEKKATEDNKKNLTPPSAPPVIPSGKKQAYPVITSASRSEVNAYVSGVIEDGGICTATATQNSVTKTATSVGSANVSYTSCAPVNISLPAGSWSIVVSYSSASYEGQSQNYEVK